MNLEKELIGKGYPIKDVEGNVVGFKEITDAVMMQNVAGITIGLNNKKPDILIGLLEASNLVKENNPVTLK